MSIPSLLTVRQFCEKHRAFPENGIRNRIFYEKQNGMAAAGVIVRNGRRILINEDAFFKWLLDKNEEGRNL